MTIEELSKLSDDELRAVCAEICGWRRTTDREFKTHAKEWINDVRHEVANTFDVPMYPQNLNAMHEARATMTEDECKEYNNALMDAKPPRREIKTFAERWTWGSTAREHCIAFIAVKQSSAATRPAIQS